MAIIYAVILEIAKREKRKNKQRKKWQRYITIYGRALILARRASVASHFAAMADALSELLSTSKRFSIFLCLRAVHVRVRVRACTRPPPPLDRARVFHVGDKSRTRDEGRARRTEGGFPLRFFPFSAICIRRSAIPPISDIGGAPFDKVAPKRPSRSSSRCRPRAKSISR
jgi:hypothetical protein